MIYYKDLKDLVFGMHEKIGVNDVDELTIVSGYVGFEPIEELGNLPLEIHAKVVYAVYTTLLGLHLFKCYLLFFSPSSIKQGDSRVLCT